MHTVFRASARSPSRAGFVTLAFMSLATAACSSPASTAITVAVESNIDDLARLRIYAGGFGVMPGDPRIDRMRSAEVPSLVPGSVTVSAQSEDPNEELFVWVRGDLADGRAVITRAQIRYRRGERRTELLFLARECLNPDAQTRCNSAGGTCSEGGRCIPLSRDGVTPPVTDAGTTDVPAIDVVAAPDTSAPETSPPDVPVVSCSAGQISCGGMCVNPNSDALHCGRCGAPCRADQQCLNGGCACAVGRANCGGSYCADLTSDAMNCGTCARACPSGQRCAGGTCS